MLLKQKTQKYLPLDSADDVLEIVRSEGSHVFDSKEKKYIDFVMGWCVGNFGWNNEKIKNAIRYFNGPTYVRPGQLYAPWVELAELLAEMTPGKLQKSFRATGGTEAVDIALQASMAHTGRRKFVSIEGSYHGNSIGTRSVASSDEREELENLLPNCHKLEPPLDEKALGKVETLLKNKDVAAFIMEPVICNLGVMVPEIEFMQGLQKLCRKYGTLLIMDEVATGFGRTGKLFATEHFDLEPDIMTLGKAITGGHAAMGAVIMTEDVAKSAEEIGFWSTYGWHPLSVAAALATLHALRDNKERLLANVSAISDYIRERLETMEFKKPPELNIKGLAICIETGSKDYASELQKRCRKEGLLVDQQNASIIMFPALTIDQAMVREALDIFENCVEDTRRYSKGAGEHGGVYR